MSAQVIREHGTRMGTLVTLRDIESLERIGNQLQVSERLAALGRVTAGVAHEVKNPLNSMRLWLEVLKANMPVDPEPQQAVKMLDSEIDRLDRAVKTFLNFTKPVELKLEETDMRPLLAGRDRRGAPFDREGRLDLRVDLPSEFPTVLMDRQLIHQAMLNLRAERIASSPTPGGRITLGLRRSGESAVISVADSGKGISPEDQKKDLPAVLHHPARRYRHRTGEHLSICATAQRSDRIRFGGRARNHFPGGTAAGALGRDDRRKSSRLQPALR